VIIKRTWDRILLPHEVLAFLEEKDMEKYGVEIDPNKIPKEKKAGKGDKDPHPNTNIPLDSEKGSEPFERKPDDAPKK
jgi:hypothetical protein